MKTKRRKLSRQASLGPCSRTIHPKRRPMANSFRFKKKILGLLNASVTVPYWKCYIYTGKLYCALRKTKLLVLAILS